MCIHGNVLVYCHFNKTIVLFSKLLLSVEVLLKAAGDAPIMKKKKWSVDGTKTVAYLIEFIRKYIKCEPSDSLVSII